MWLMNMPTWPNRDLIWPSQMPKAVIQIGWWTWPRTRPTRPVAAISPRATNRSTKKGFALLNPHALYRAWGLANRELEKDRSIMPYYRKLFGTKCYLSPPSIEDAQTWARWFNDLDIALPLGDEAQMISGLAQEKRNIQDAMKEGSHVFSIVDLESDTLIGCCILFNVDQTHRHAMLGIGEKPYQNRGYGQETIRLLLDFAFNLLNLHNVILGFFEFNERARRCYERVGFKEIGRRRQIRAVAGKRCDVVLMDILADEFESPMVGRLIVDNDSGTDSEAMIAESPTKS